jgi:hypothetical protein
MLGSHLTASGGLKPWTLDRVCLIHARRTRAKPSHAKPSHAKPSHAKPSSARLSRPRLLRSRCRARRSSACDRPCARIVSSPMARTSRSLRMATGFTTEQSPSRNPGPSSDQSRKCAQLGPARPAKSRGSISCFGRRRHPVRPSRGSSSTPCGPSGARVTSRSRTRSRGSHPASRCVPSGNLAQSQSSSPGWSTAWPIRFMPMAPLKRSFRMEPCASDRLRNCVRISRTILRRIASAGCYGLHFPNTFESACRLEPLASWRRTHQFE